MTKCEIISRAARKIIRFGEIGNILIKTEINEKNSDKLARRFPSNSTSDRTFQDFTFLMNLTWTLTYEDQNWTLTYEDKKTDTNL